MKRSKSNTEKEQKQEPPSKMRIKENKITAETLLRKLEKLQESLNLLESTCTADKQYLYDQGNLKPVWESTTTEYEWIIHNITDILCTNDSSMYIYSPSFLSKGHGIFKWKLLLRLNVDPKHSKFHVSAALSSQNEDDVKVTSVFYFKTNDRIFKKFELEDVIIKPHKNSGSNKLFEREPLLKILADKTLVISCRIIRACSVSSANVQMFNTEVYRLSNDLEMLLNNQKFSDITLVAGDKEFKAHKAIITARTNILSGSTENNLTSNVQDLIKINVEPKAFMEMLRFIYCGKIENFEYVASDLILAAKEYEVVGLKEICMNYLWDSLSVENVVKRLIFAVEHKIDFLKGQAENFIVSHAKDIVNRPDFSEVEGLGASYAINLFRKILEKKEL